MKINKKDIRTIQASDSKTFVKIIDQTLLPHQLVFKKISKLDEVISAIKTMQVRGAPLIGVTAAFGVALAIREKADSSDAFIAEVSKKLINSRPTAVNLAWAVNRVSNLLHNINLNDRLEAAWAFAQQIADDDVNTNKSIGIHGLQLIKKLNLNKVNIMTHCNAGWLATVDYGTALSPIFFASEAGMNIHVWVSETRPRNQGTNLTAWELEQAKIPHTIIADNAAGFLMQQGQVDCILVGADRIGIDGQVVNKIGTYLKAVAAHEHQIPFYVAAPLSTVDVNFMGNQKKSFEIEHRDPEELLTISGINKKGDIDTLKIGLSAALNPAFDITPSKYVTSVISEEGIIDPENIGRHING